MANKECVECDKIADAMLDGCHNPESMYEWKESKGHFPGCPNGASHTMVVPTQTCQNCSAKDTRIAELEAHILRRHKHGASHYSRMQAKLSQRIAKLEVLRDVLIKHEREKSIRLYGGSYRWYAEKVREYSDGPDFMAATADLLERIASAVDIYDAGQKG